MKLSTIREHGSRPIRLAFIGSGGWARKYHFRALEYVREHYSDRFDLHLHGIHSLEHEQAQAVAKQYGFAQVYPTLDALLADEEIDAIAVAITPAALRAVLERLAPLGKPIFSEKPPGTSTADAQALSATVTVPNVLAFNRRYIPLNNHFKRIVDDMEDVYYVAGHFLRHNRRDEDFMIGTGIHWINFMEYVCGEITHVTTERWPHPQNESWLRVARLTFAGGLRGMLKVFPCSGIQVERLEIHSNAQSVYLDGPLWKRAGSITVARGDEREVISLEAAAPLPEVVRLGIVGEYEEFLTTVLTGAPTRSNFQNAVNAMRVAELMEKGESCQNSPIRV